MNSNYLNVKNIYSLNSISEYVKSKKNHDDIVIFFDLDDTISNPDTNKIIEPEITKELFDYIQKNQIFYSIITGRFYDIVCDDNKRNLAVIQTNILTTIYPVLNKLGIDTSKHQSNLFKQNPYKIYDEQGKCVGILYMGIFFSGNKGETIKNYLRHMNLRKKEIIFVDDYEPYLYEVSTALPSITIFRRLYFK